jgi:hypothetical protein
VKVKVQVQEMMLCASGIDIGMLLGREIAQVAPFDAGRRIDPPSVPKCSQTDYLDRIASVGYPSRPHFS